MTQDIRICFIGDSLVNGTGDEAALGWAGRLCAMANASDIPVTYYNLGIRRNTSKDILLRWESECTLRLPDSCDGRIALSCGVNDTAIENGRVRVDSAESCANVRAILRGAKQYTVLMVGPPPVLDDEQNERIEDLSVAFARETQTLGVPYIDLFSALCSDDAYKREIARNDGAHPRSEGYSKMARIIGSSPSWWFHTLGES
ncbi:MAG: lipase [Gemmatimonadetes bacterium]|nr:lipase [Gemmatimonadota bacterium]MYC74086.1 lipase [Gemmatimonadota bacterium]MYI63572.1 lipase [Gemmatimonadota bacterium]